MNVDGPGEISEEQARGCGQDINYPMKVWVGVADTPSVPASQSHCQCVNWWHQQQQLGAFIQHLHPVNLHFDGPHTGSTWCLLRPRQPSWTQQLAPVARDSQRVATEGLPPEVRRNHGAGTAMAWCSDITTTQARATGLLLPLRHSHATSTPHQQQWKR